MKWLRLYAAYELRCITVFIAKPLNIWMRINMPQLIDYTLENIHSSYIVVRILIIKMTENMKTSVLMGKWPFGTRNMNTVMLGTLILKFQQQQRTSPIKCSDPIKRNFHKNIVMWVEIGFGACIALNILECVLILRTTVYTRFNCTQYAYIVRS